MLKLMRKTVTILLVISLIYANAAGTAFSIISYALDNEESFENTKEIEEKEEFALTLETSEFCKNNMSEKETEYEEKINLNLDSEHDLNEIKINDVKTSIIDDKKEENVSESEPELEMESETEPEKNIDIFYKSTKINKEDLIRATGENGNLEIKYIELEREKEELEKATLQVQNDMIELEKIEEKNIMLEESSTLIISENSEESTIIQENPEKNEITEETEKSEIENEEVEEEKTEEQLENEEITGIIDAQDGTVVINAETEADEEGYITIIYPEKSVVSVDIRIETEIKKIENLEILNTRIVEKVSDIEKANLLETTKQIIVNGEEEIYNQQKIFDRKICKPKPGMPTL